MDENRSSEESAAFDESVRGQLTKIFRDRWRCHPVWEPQWLREKHEKQLQTFLQPCTPDGLFKVAHARLRAVKDELLQTSAKSMSSGQSAEHVKAFQAAAAAAAPREMRKALKDVSGEEVKALAVWLGLASRPGAPMGWKSQDDVVLSVPFLCPFGKQTELVALLDFKPPKAEAAAAKGAVNEKGEPVGALGTWAIPDTCPDILANLRAVGLELPRCVEWPACLLDSQGAPLSPVITTLQQELALPQIAWAEVLMSHVFPWARGDGVDGTARQGLMSLLVQRWSDMGLAGNEECLDALQQVPFVSTVSGKTLKPAQILDPSVEGLRRLYCVADGTSTGPFPSADSLQALSAAAQQGVLRFRKELTVPELLERLAFLDAFKDSHEVLPQEIRIVADELLLYIADNVVERCNEVVVKAAEVEVGDQTASPLAPPETAASVEARQSSFSNFFGWSAAVRSIADVFSQREVKRVPWNLEEVEALQAKLRSARWLPAAAAPQEWPSMAPWAGQALRLWHPEEMRLMPEFWTCGAAKPVLCFDTQFGLSGERKLKVQKLFMDILAIHEQLGTDELRKITHEQLDIIKKWWDNASEEDRGAATAWMQNCLNRTYPNLEIRPPPPPSPGDPPPWELKALFVDGNFVLLEDISIEQNFSAAGLHQVPAQLRTLPAIRWRVKPAFDMRDLSRALQRLKVRQIEEKRPQLHAQELDAAVRLAMAMHERARSHDEGVPEGALIPTRRAVLRPASQCIFDNMKWLSPEEQAKRSAVVDAKGLDWVHTSISNDVASGLGVRGLNALVAAEAMGESEEDGDDKASWFEAAGQMEPLTTRLRTFLRDIHTGMSMDLTIFKEIIQNADDAKATQVHFVWDWRRFGTQSLLSSEMARWQGPCLWAYNDASFAASDFENLQRLGAMQKVRGSRNSQIGRFGLGFNAVYNLTDLPSILSNDLVLFLDPHVRHLKAMGASPQKPGIKLMFLKIDVLEKFRDQFEPYHGLLGCDLSNSAKYNGTLIRLPFRTQEAAKASEINSFVMTPRKAEESLMAFRAAAAECLLFLQHVKEVKFSWIPAGTGPGAEPEELVRVGIEPPRSDVTDGLLSTDANAYDYRQLFSSRTFAQSKEQRSFIAGLLKKMGLQNEEAPQSHVTFNLEVKLTWRSLPDFEWKDQKLHPNGELKDVWRLYLRHDDAAEIGWKKPQARQAIADEASDGNQAEAASAAPAVVASDALEDFASAQVAGGDFVPFAGLALCLSRSLSPEEPRISCFLPLPMQSSLPFLINANFVLCDPTSPSRLDLMSPGANNAGKETVGSSWNRLLMQELLIPLISSCLMEQAKALGQLAHRSGGTMVPNCASWAAGAAGGISALMPTQGQLPQSLKELIDLQRLYASLADSRLFLPMASPVAAVTALDTEAGALLSYTGSVQPLGADEASEAQQKALLEYFNAIGSFMFCAVPGAIVQEFKQAKVQRQAVISRALLIQNLRTKRPPSAGIAPQLLDYLLSGDLGGDPAAQLKGLQVVPLCDKTVVSFKDPAAANAPEVSNKVWCSFPGQPGELPSLAFQVLQRLCPHATLDARPLSRQAAEALKRCASSLGIKEVKSCADLAKALASSLPAITAVSPGASSGNGGAAPASSGNIGSVVSGVASAVGTMVSTITGAGAVTNEAVVASALRLGTASEADELLVALWGFIASTPEDLKAGITSFLSFYIIPALDVDSSAWNMRAQVAGQAVAPIAAHASQQGGVQPGAESTSPPPPPPPPPGTAVSTQSMPGVSLQLLALNPGKPLLLPPEDRQNSNAFARVVMQFLPDRFVNSGHPSMSSELVHAFVEMGLVMRFSPLSVLMVLTKVVSAAGEHKQVRHSTVAARCTPLLAADRDLLCNELALSLPSAMTAPEEGTTEGEGRQPSVEAFCCLPIFLSEAGYRQLRRGAAPATAAAAAAPAAAGSTQEQGASTPQQSPGNAPDNRGLRSTSYRPIYNYTVIEGEPLELTAPRGQLDLFGSNIFTRSPSLPRPLEQALRLEPVKEHLKARKVLLDQKEWLLKISLHISDMAREDQVLLLGRLLPLVALERAQLPPIIPAEVPGAGGPLLKSPDGLLDPHDITVMAVFGLSGDSLPVLPTSSQFHFPAHYIPAALRTHLRTLGLRSSANDPHVLLFLMQHLRDRREALSKQRYGEVQRTLMQRLVESWPNLPREAHAPLLATPFVELSPEADGGELSETVFSLKPFRDEVMEQLKPLQDLVSRAETAPYVSWMSAPLVPRGFPNFVGYRQPTLDLVVQHATALSGLADSTSISGHLWPELCEKVIPAICSFIASCAPFSQALTPPPADGEQAPDATSAASRSAVAAKLRRTKFLAVPLDSTSGESGPHSLVAPWRISLVLREHRPPMFALPAYLADHVPLLKLLGVRDALEVPSSGAGGSSGLTGGTQDAAAAASSAMRWLFENGPESFADVTVHCEDGRLQLHRNILMARSEYFRAMFQHGEEGFSFREAQEGGATVHLLEANMAVANVIFGFLYHGSIDEAALEGAEGPANAVSLLMLSDQLGVPHLMEFAQLWIANQQDLVDCADTLEIAERHHAELLEGATLAFMAANMDEAEVEQQLPRLSDKHRAALMDMVRDRAQRRVAQGG